MLVEGIWWISVPLAVSDIAVFGLISTVPSADCAIMTTVSSFWAEFEYSAQLSVFV